MLYVLECAIIFKGKVIFSNIKIPSIETVPQASQLPAGPAHTRGPGRCQCGREISNPLLAMDGNKLLFRRNQKIAE